MQIKKFKERDWCQLWPIIKNSILAADTFTYDPAMTEPHARDMWVEEPPGLTVVAQENGVILGTAKMGPNRQGPGAHISTASFLVAENARNRGVGAALVLYAIDWAKTNHFAGMQFNAVAESNHAAIHLYGRFGFKVIGTVPMAFAHPILGRLGLNIMYKEF
jgi:GNAT superfamily N-acetyltransferase